MAPTIGSKVKFSSKTAQQYSSLSTKDPNTIYFISDTYQIYLGSDEYCPQSDGVIDYTSQYQSSPATYHNDIVEALVTLTSGSNQRGKIVLPTKSAYVTTYYSGNVTFSIVVFVSSGYPTRVLFYQNQQLVMATDSLNSPNKGSIIIDNLEDLENESQLVVAGTYDSRAANKKYVDIGGGLNIYLTYNAGGSLYNVGQYAFTTNTPSRYIYTALNAGKQIRIHCTDPNFIEFHTGNFTVYFDPNNANYKILSFTAFSNGSQLSISLRFKNDGSSNESTTASGRVIYSTPVVIPYNVWYNLALNGQSIDVRGFFPSEGKIIYLEVQNNVFHNPVPFPYVITISGVTAPISYMSYTLSEQQSVDAYPGAVVGLYYDGDVYRIINTHSIVSPF